MSEVGLTTTSGNVIAATNLNLMEGCFYEISWKWIVFPIATVNMKNGELYKFIIFNKSRFAKWFQEYSR